tara:strand:+ start:560 stop:916 length:357 start_codon:yes stop_codon:yes gene_type:complete
MPSIQDQISIAANANDNNILVTQGKALCNIPPDAVAVCRLLATGSATGLRARFVISGREEMEDSDVSIANRVPLDPDDIMCDRVAAGPLSRLQIAVRNTTGGALIFFYRVAIDYFPRR